MATTVADAAPTRRTQAERRARTRAALLDATIDCLVEEGYAGTTTRGIAERAGVTPGALQHHFATKTDLLRATRRHISEKVALEIGAYAPAAAMALGPRSEYLLDRMWELGRGPLFRAEMELSVAAGTDRELRRSLVEAQREGAEAIVAVGPLLYPELADRPAFAQLIATAQATVRGLALLRFVNDEDADRAWPSTRAHLLALGLQLSAGEAAS
jgi:AcrR family transcriptional regulator